MFRNLFLLMASVFFIVGCGVKGSPQVPDAPPFIGAGMIDRDVDPTPTPSPAPSPTSQGGGR